MNQFALKDDEIKPYFLDILSYKHLAQEITERLDEFHQSPQVLLIKAGECFYEESHLDINYEEIEEEVKTILKK